MTRLVLCLLLWLPVVATATPLLVSIEPTAPVLGKPLTIIIPLPDREAALAGLPDLGAFELLAPPLRSGDTIRLVVLPMRSGPRDIPPFPLQVGTSRQIETAARTVTVLEGIAKDATLAPFKHRPIPLVGQGRGWLLPSGAGFIFLLLAGWLLWRRLSRVPFAELPTETQLVEMQRRLSRVPASAERSALLEEIVRRRFAPLPTSRDELATLRSAVFTLLGALP